ncbi:MAG: anti-sigma factor [Clostridia bacterium]|nr:anti-sigma factor [Clostridia bacterium]
MTCNMAERMISAYIDRELSEDEKRRVRQHLAVCSDCMALYDSMTRVKSALGSMPAAKVPEDLWFNVERSITSASFSLDPSRPRGFRGRWNLALGFVKLVAPAAIAGTAIAIPLVQMIFGVSFFGTAAGPGIAVGARGKAPAVQSTFTTASGQTYSAKPASSLARLELLNTSDGWLTSSLQPSLRPASAGLSWPLSDLYEGVHQNELTLDDPSTTLPWPSPYTEWRDNK